MRAAQLESCCGGVDTKRQDDFAAPQAKVRLLRRRPGLTEEVLASVRPLQAHRSLYRGRGADKICRGG